MAKKLSSVLGVDVGSKYIKVAEVKLQGRQPVVTAIGMVETPQGSVDHVGINDPKAVGTVLKQLCTQVGASVNDVVLSLAGQGSILVRTLEVPTMNDGELKQHMEWEINRNIPFSESTVVSDYKAFPPDQPGAQNMDVVMAIAPQSVVDMMGELLKTSGKKPAAYDVEPLGIARTLKVGYESEYAGKTVCVVEVGHKTTAINIYKDGKLLMPRQVPIGGEMFTRSIADTLGVSTEEAEEMKVRDGRIPNDAATAAPAFNTFETQSFAPYNPFGDPTEEAAPAEETTEIVAPEPTTPEPASGGAMSEESMRVYNAMAGVVEEFAAEIRRSVDYYRSKGGDVDVVLLCGGGSRLKGLGEFIESMLQIPTHMMNPLKGITVSAKKADSGSIEENKEEYAVAVGNGLHICF